ncbi:MAG: outer membrane beta-barrel protein [Gemmatirosa sp.]
MPTHRSPSSRPVRLRYGVVMVGIMVVVLAVVAGAPAAAAAQDLRYNLTPTAQQVTWDDALGLDNTLLYGGRLGVVFGRRIELQGFYLTNQGADARIRDLYDRLNVTERPPQNPGLGVQNYGAAVVYNFALGGFTPFLRGGGSVVRFEPDGARASDRIAVSYGGGLRFGKPGGLRFNVFAEDLRFRVDRTLLLALPTPAAGAPPVIDADAEKLRSNLTYGAGLSIPLGGGAATYDDTPQYQLGNVALPVDVFAGRHQFAGASGLPRQNLVGVRTGIDFGPLVGLRGFYWQGVNDDFDGRQGVRGYGGEAQFALNAGPGFNPFLLAGAGQIDFGTSYDRIATGGGTGGATATVPDDQTALILGGGVKVPVGTRFTLTGAARNYLAAVSGRTEDVSERSQLRSNWQYSVGLSLGIGGRGARRRETPAARRDTVFVDRATGRPVARPDTSVARAPERLADGAATVERYAVTSSGDTVRGAAIDSVLAADRGARLVEVRRVAGAVTGAATGYATERTVTVPVPSEGEIIVRYGPQRAPAPLTIPVVVVPPIGALAPGSAPRVFVREMRERDGRRVREYREADGSLTREWVDDRNRVVREPARPSMAAPAPPDPIVKDAPRDARTGEFEARVTARLDSLERVAAGRAASERDTARAATASDPESVRAIVREELAREERLREERARDERAGAEAPPPATNPGVPGTWTGGVQGGMLYSGATFTDAAQALVGARLDFGALSPSLPGFRLVPEVAFGVGGGGTSIYVAANALYEVGRLFGGRPRVSLGAGLLNFSDRVGSRDGLDLVITPAYGLALPLARFTRFRLPGGGATSPELVVEHQGVGFFDVNRAVIGIGWRR